jgi:hypothetical protein
MTAAYRVNSARTAKFASPCGLDAILNWPEAAESRETRHLELSNIVLNEPGGSSFRMNIGISGGYTLNSTNNPLLSSNTYGTTLDFGARATVGSPSPGIVYGSDSSVFGPGSSRGTIFHGSASSPAIIAYGSSSSPGTVVLGAGSISANVLGTGPARPSAWRIGSR